MRRGYLGQDIGCYLDADCGSATPAISGTVTISLNSAIASSGHFTLDTGNDDITFLESGVYLVLFTFTADASSASRATSRAWIQVDQGAGFSTLVHTLRYGYNRNTSEGENSVTCHAIIPATGGVTKVRAQCGMVSSTANVLESACSWSISRLAAA